MLHSQYLPRLLAIMLLFASPIFHGAAESKVISSSPSELPALKLFLDQQHQHASDKQQYHQCFANSNRLFAHHHHNQHDQQEEEEEEEEEDSVVVVAASPPPARNLVEFFCGEELENTLKETWPELDFVNCPETCDSENKVFGPTCLGTWGENCFDVTCDTEDVESFINCKDPNATTVEFCFTENLEVRFEPHTILSQTLTTIETETSEASRTFEWVFNDGVSNFGGSEFTRGGDEQTGFTCSFAMILPDSSSGGNAQTTRKTCNSCEYCNTTDVALDCSNLQEGAVVECSEFDDGSFDSYLQIWEKLIIFGEPDPPEDNSAAFSVFKSSWTFLNITVVLVVLLISRALV